ncbi:DMT family transporter [Fulvivirga sp. M361]|nr:DMT family transporter [Fulvivirga sp. M361]
MLLVSTSGVLGRYISMPPPVTIWWRCVIAVLFLMIFCWWRKIDLRIHHKKDMGTLVIGGLLLGGHWITYFYALQHSNVAIGMLSLFTYPALTSLLEPLILKTRFRLSHILLGTMVLLGIYFLAPGLDLQNEYTKGIALGLISSLMYSLRNILLKHKAARYPGQMLMLYQLVFFTALGWPALLFMDTTQIVDQWPATLTLALVTTAIGHTLFVMSFKHFSISTASIMSSSQPIYGIILGMVFLSEIPGLNTVIGGSIIIATVIIESVRSYK